MTTISAVTLERFERGLSYREYLAGIAVNRDKFAQYYASIQLTDDDVSFFRDAAEQPSGPARVLVIAEAWCPDVFRGVPVFARIAEAAGMAMKVVARDEHPDIMDEFLLNGKARAIPVAVFYTRDHHYITHWIERPAIAHAEIARLREEFKTLHPTLDPGTATGADREIIISFFDARLPRHYPAWQVETVREIKQLLANVPAAVRSLHPTHA